MGDDVGVEASVPSSASFFTMPCRTAVTRCASIAESVGPSSFPSRSIDPAASG